MMHMHKKVKYSQTKLNFKLMILHNLVGAWSIGPQLKVSTHAGHVGKQPFHYGGLFSFENDEEFEYV